MNVTARDYGAYRCVAKNQYGEADGVITFHRKLLSTLFYTHQLALERTADGQKKKKVKMGIMHVAHVAGRSSSLSYVLPRLELFNWQQKVFFLFKEYLLVMAPVSFRI